MKNEAEIRAAAMAMEAAMNTAIERGSDAKQINWMRTQLAALCWVLELEVSADCKIVENALDGMVQIMREAQNN